MTDAVSAPDAHSQPTLSRRDIQLEVDGETLACDLIAPTPETPASLLFLHGAGQSSRARQWPLRELLAQQGWASAALDFSGHGQSSARLPASLAKREREAQAVLDALTTPLHAQRTVIGVSMGGEIAMRLACRERSQIGHLVTLVGAIYDAAAFELPFGPAFSAALRRPDSWRDAEVLHLIAGFRGDITMVRAMEDQVIPPQVAELIHAHALAAHSCRIVDLAQVDHRLSERCAQDAELARRIAALIAPTHASTFTPSPQANITP